MHYLVFVWLLILSGSVSGCASLVKDHDREAPQPLYVDPTFDGAADPSIVRDEANQRWLMFYTNRRANIEGLNGVSWVHGTPIGIAASGNGRDWTYLQDASFSMPVDVPTLWAPEVFIHNGTFHMYLTLVPGIFNDWQHPRAIGHFTSADLLHWEYQSTLSLNSKKVIDADIIALPGGGFRLFYNDEPDGKSIYYADSDNLYDWVDKGKAALPSRGEGPVVFNWQGEYWMIVDAWRGLAVYRSADLIHWQQQAGYLLAERGVGKDDAMIGQHPDVVVKDNRAYLFYFTHPGLVDGKPDTSDHALRRSVIQITELQLLNNQLITDRNKPVYIDW
ncbi:MAG: glycosyl hydrolase [Alteromonadaceae bacterium]|nr:glycosyl hydrolase [Alteromonadaceae bacterium]